MPHVVIIGGGFGGLAATRVFAGEPVSVTLIDRRNHHLFQPLLYQVATAGLSPAEIGAPLRWIFRRQQNVRVLMGEVQAIDLSAREVVLDGEERIGWDHLIVATGVTHAYFGRDEWAKHAPGLKTLEDALGIRARILTAFERAERSHDPSEQRHYLTFVVVGGGPTGIELAGTLAEIARQTLRDEFRHVETEAARIVVIEAGPTILSSFAPVLRDAARHALRRLGVDVWENARVTDIDAESVTVGTEAIFAKTILWAAGVEGSPLGRALGAPMDRAGRVIVLPDLTIPEHPEVSVVGDLASFSESGTPLPGVAQVAMQQGGHAAANVLRRLKGESAIPFHYRDLGSMATIGRGQAIAEVFGRRLTGMTAWFAWLFIHLVSLIGFKNRLFVMIQWTVAYVGYGRGVRLITGPRGG